MVVVFAGTTLDAGVPGASLNDCRGFRMGSSHDDVKTNWWLF